MKASAPTPYKAIHRSLHSLCKALCPVGRLSACAVGAVLSLIPIMGTAQDSLLLRDYDFVKATDAWLTSRNGAAQTRLATKSLNRAEVGLTRQRGGWTDFSGSPDVVEAGASVESLYRISKRTVVSGSMSYTHFTGKEMGGSTFLLTDHTPFDIEEDSLTNLGKKQRDTYHLTGGIGVDVWRGLSVGARIDYTAANYAKYKDLRHKNKLMDMTLTIGAYMPIGQVLHIGANYYYRRTNESVVYNTYGREEKVYKSFINYGPFIGEVEQFSITGLTERGREMPMSDNTNGGSVQVGIEVGQFSLTNELTAAHRSGYYGRRSPYTITFARHSSDIYEYHGRLAYNARGMQHHLDLSIRAENLVNYFTSYRELTNESSATYYEYYDDVKSANKLWVEGHASYTAHWGIRGELPTWSLTAGYQWLHRKQTAYVYPYYRRQTIDTGEGYLACTRHLLIGPGELALTLRGSFKKGHGAPFEDLTFATPSDKQTPPPTMEAWLYREHQWLTSAQYGIGGDARYCFPVSRTRLVAFVGLAASHRKANETNDYSIGRDRTTLEVKAGCRF